MPFAFVCSPPTAACTAVACGQWGLAGAARAVGPVRATLSLSRPLRLRIVGTARSALLVFCFFDILFHLLSGGRCPPVPMGREKGGPTYRPVDFGRTSAYMPKNIGKSGVDLVRWGSSDGRAVRATDGQVERPMGRSSDHWS